MVNDGYDEIDWGDDLEAVSELRARAYALVVVSECFCVLAVVYGLWQLGSWVASFL